jgi:formate dehydrogenase subunit gamma
MASVASAPRYVRRFTLTERLLHWIHASAFFVLLGSGLVLYLPSLSTAVARRPLIKDIHFWTGISWAGAILLVSLLGNRRALAATIREIDLFDRDDRRFLAGSTHAPQGRFNAGQKVNAVLTAAFATLFFVSGLLLWYGERDTRFRLPGTLFLHDALMYLSVVIVAGHLYLSLIHPTTRHALRGMTLGTVRADWARAHHAKWYAQPSGRAATEEHLGGDPGALGRGGSRLGAVQASNGIGDHERVAGTRGLDAGNGRNGGDERLAPAGDHDRSP